VPQDRVPHADRQDAVQARKKVLMKSIWLNSGGLSDSMTRAKTAPACAGWVRS